MRWPQTSQSGRGLAAETSERSEVQRSKERRVRRMRLDWPVRYLRDSVTCSEAAKLTAVERIPEVSQVSTGPLGGLGKMQARQAVTDEVGGSSLPRPGRMFIVAAYEPMAAA